MSGRGTRAIEILRRAGRPHVIHEYATGDRDDRRRDDRQAYGREAVEALGVSPERVFKTLVALVDDRPAVAVVPVDGELDLKLLADALAGRRAAMADPAAAERLTGYVVGGISPLGQRRLLPTVIDRAALDHATILVSAGRRGLQIEIAPHVLAELAGARIASIARPSSR